MGNVPKKFYMCAITISKEIIHVLHLHKTVRTFWFRCHLLGLVQYFNGLVPPALVYVEQAELHQRVGNQIVVKLDLLFTEHTQEKKLVN